MKLKEKPLLLVLGIVFFAASAFVLADTAADETKVPNETKTPVFTDSAILVYFNLDAGEVERTVLIGASALT